MVDLTELSIAVVEGDAVLAIARELLLLCNVAFDTFSDSYLLERLPLVDGRAVLAARDQAGRLLGFKLGYRRGSTLFYPIANRLRTRTKRYERARQRLPATAAHGGRHHSPCRERADSYFAALSVTCAPHYFEAMKHTIKPRRASSTASPAVRHLSPDQLSQIQAGFGGGQSRENFAFGGGPSRENFVIDGGEG